MLDTQHPPVVVIHELSASSLMARGSSSRTRGSGSSGTSVIGDGARFLARDLALRMAPCCRSRSMLSGLTNSATGTRARAVRARAEHPSQLDYSGACCRAIPGAARCPGQPRRPPHPPTHHITCPTRSPRRPVSQEGLFRELNPGPLAPEARIIPLDQTAGCYSQCV
jgi:hypothetical protein